MALVCCINYISTSRSRVVVDELYALIFWELLTILAFHWCYWSCFLEPSKLVPWLVNIARIRHDHQN